MPNPGSLFSCRGQRHIRFPGVPRTKSSILLTIRIHQMVTGLPTTLDAFNAISQGETLLASTTSVCAQPLQTP
jgi:hypothetical protein